MKYKNNDKDNEKVFKNQQAQCQQTNKSKIFWAEINLTEGFQSSCRKPAAKEVIDLNGAKSSQIVRLPEILELNNFEI